MMTCKTEEINGLVDELKANVILLVSSMRSEDYSGAIDVLVSIDSYIDGIVREVAVIESHRDREHEMASKLRKMLGDSLNKDCDKAGIK